LDPSRGTQAIVHASWLYLFVEAVRPVNLVIFWLNDIRRLGKLKNHFLIMMKKEKVVIILKQFSTRVVNETGTVYDNQTFSRFVQR
jgi:hypothetical protein